MKIKTFLMALGMLSLVLTSVVVVSSATPSKNASNGQAAVAAAAAYYQDIIETSADGNEGTPLKSFKILSADSTDVNNVQLQVALTYEGSGTMPPAPVTIVKEQGEYVVKQEIIVYDMNPKSPTYKTAKVGNANFNTESSTRKQP
ncbi:hypothetical protein [Paenibacillus sp. CF384]|uniref:hypothetical protein n=1 Tax=Paenibacillus sp. CF384 TaxID=1884382 RepID=UPI00089833DB|nr:hypothetical protein [Paenibacillus sp. CF384]SDX32553.1 hypothetical protein SAMN05518855_101261 [Paenibacillus sp. CF384]